MEKNLVNDIDEMDVQSLFDATASQPGIERLQETARVAARIPDEPRPAWRAFGALFRRPWGAVSSVALLAVVVVSAYMLSEPGQSVTEPQHSQSVAQVEANPMPSAPLVSENVQNASEADSPEESLDWMTGSSEEYGFDYLYYPDADVIAQVSDQTLLMQAYDDVMDEI